MNSGHLIRINLLIFVLYILLHNFESSLVLFQILKAFFGTTIILVSGLNLAILLKVILKKNFDLVELLNLTFLGIIIFIPFLLLIETALLKKTYPLQSIATLLLILIFLILFLKNTSVFLFRLPSITKKMLRSPLTRVIVLELFVISAIVFLYKFLPDRDPYKWHLRLTQYIESGNLSNFSYRPLFYSISFLFSSLTSINTFIFLKYTIPFLSLSSFLPIWMVARKLNDPRKQTLLLLIPFLAPNAIQYSLMGMPQAFFMILLYYFVFFLFYSHLTGNKFYYYTAGIISLGCTLYHEAGIIIIGIWIILAFLYNWKRILTKKRDVLFIFIILLSNISMFEIHFHFVIVWIKEIISTLLHPQFNYTFPIKYTTVDGIEAGSQNLIGVIKTYLGYAGPAIIAAVLVMLYLLFKKNTHLKKYYAIIKKSRELQIILVGFLIFFAIAEVLPRFPGIALLPDRAWIFASIFFSFFILLFVFEIPERKISNRLYYAYIICIFLSIGGAIYGNYPKKNLIPDAQLQSAKWIEQKLPANRIVLSSGHNQLLQYFSQSKVFYVSVNFFNDKMTLATELDNLKNEIFNNKNNKKNSRLKAYTNALTLKANECTNIDSSSKDTKEKNDALKKIAADNIKLSQDFINNLDPPIITDITESTFALSSLPIYIYYTAPLAEAASAILSEYPEEFNKVYEKDTLGEKIIIWKAL